MAQEQETRTKHAPAPATPEVLDPNKAPPDSRRLLVLLHGEKAGDKLVRDAIQRLREDGHQVMVRVTYEAGDVDRLVKEALTLKSADTLVAAGGDGTICEVVAAVLKHTGGLKDTTSSEEPAEPPIVPAKGEPPTLQELSVGILPMGTSNDFAATTGIPQDPYESLLLATQQSSLKALDVGLLNGKVFMNTATIGASAEVGKVTSSKIKKILGPFAFLFTGAKSIRSWSPVTSVLAFPNIKEHGSFKDHKQAPNEEGTSIAKALIEDTPATVAREAAPDGSSTTHTPRGDNNGNGNGKAGESDTPVSSAEVSPNLKTSSSMRTASLASATGSVVGELEGVPLLHITAANNRQIASMVSVAPNAVLDDGMLDTVYFTGEPVQQVKRLLQEVLYKGVKDAKVVPTLLRVPWLEVAAEKPMEWSLDGEPQEEPATNFRFSLLHRAVKFHLPDNRMLVAGQPEPEPKDAQLADKRKGHHSGKPRFPGNPLKLPRGRLRPPTLGDMLGRVVRFRKKKDWASSEDEVLPDPVHNPGHAAVAGAAAACIAILAVLYYVYGFWPRPGATLPAPDNALYPESGEQRDQDAAGDGNGRNVGAPMAHPQLRDEPPQASGGRWTPAVSRGGVRAQAARPADTPPPCRSGPAPAFRGVSLQPQRMMLPSASTPRLRPTARLMIAPTQLHRPAPVAPSARPAFLV